MLCKFYQRGYCKFGDSCRFVHENYDEEEYYDYNRSGQYSRGNDGYVNKKPQQHFSTRYDYNEQSDYRRTNHYKHSGNQYYGSDNRRAYNNRFEQLERDRVETQYEIEDEDEKNLELLQSDMKEWKDSNTMWQLSCYGPKNSCLNFPGFEEFSVEEVRLAYFKARNENNLSQYQRWLNEIADTNHRMRQQYSYVSNQKRNFVMDVIKKLEAKDNKDEKQTTNNLFKSLPSHASPFISGASQNPHTKVFGAVSQPPAILFRQQPLQPANISQQQTLGLSQQQQTQQFPRQNPFHDVSVLQQQESSFPTRQQFIPFFNQPRGNGIFSSQPSGNPPLVFGGGGVNFTSTNHGAAGNIFAGTSHGGRNDACYTDMNSLTEGESKEFQSEAFTFIPTIPPPKELV